MAHPRLTRFLQNLGPAMAAYQPAPLQVTNYPVSGLTYALQALSAGAQNYQGAQQAIEQKQMADLFKQLRQGPAGQGFAQKVQSGNLEGLTPGEQYAGQIMGAPAPQTFLGGGQRRQAEMVQGGLATTAEGAATRELQGQEGAATRTTQKEIAGMEDKTRRLQISEDARVRMAAVGADEARSKVYADQRLTEERTAIDKAMKQYHFKNPAERKVAIRATRNIFSGKDPVEDMTADEEAQYYGIESLDQYEADIRAEATGMKENDFLRLIRARVESDQRYGNWDDLPAKDPELWQAITMLSNKGALAKGTERPFQGQMEAAFKTLNDRFPMQQGRSWADIGVGLLDWIPGVDVEKKSTQVPGPPTPGQTLSAAEEQRRAELRDKVRSTGKLSASEYDEFERLQRRAGMLK